MGNFVLLQSVNLNLSDDIFRQNAESCSKLGIPPLDPPELSDQFGRADNCYHSGEIETCRQNADFCVNFFVSAQ